MKVANPRPEPLVIFDGDCTFCRFWVERFRRAAREPLQWAPSQQVGREFAEIPVAAYGRAVQVVEPDGTVLEGGDAMLRVLRAVPRWRWLVKLILLLPPLLALVRGGYGVVARNRGFFSRLTRLLWGSDPAPSTFAMGRRLFAHGLGLVFLCAFLSITVQISGLLGPQGIYPAEQVLQQVSSLTASGRVSGWMYPTLFWFSASKAALLTVCWVGVALSAVLACGILPGLCSLLLWALYLSICTVGGPFLSFQWDALLLETALLATLFLPWQLRPRWRTTTRLTTLGRWLLWWLIFRLMFESGVVKLASGDPAWRDLSALSYHYETQPLPLWTAWFAHQAPLWVHQLSALGTFAIEFLAPVAILLPRRLRHLGAYSIIALQIAIALTGNYTFFNLLTALLCLPLLDDGHWPARWRRWWLGSARPALHRARFAWPNMVLEPLAGVAFFLTTVLFINTFRLEQVRWPDFISRLYQVVVPFKSFNSYGLFAVMTKERREIVIEGSQDGQQWQAYELPWKPGSIYRRPGLVAPHQPRLDWQFWFAALAPVEQSSWVPLFMTRLLQGSPDVLALVENNPFSKSPPRYVRAVIYDYHFTRWEEGSAWWRRELLGVFHPPIELKREP